MEPPVCGIIASGAFVERVIELFTHCAQGWSGSVRLASKPAAFPGGGGSTVTRSIPSASRWRRNAGMMSSLGVAAGSAKGAEAAGIPASPVYEREICLYKISLKACTKFVHTNICITVQHLPAPRAAKATTFLPPLISASAASCEGFAIQSHPGSTQSLVPSPIG